MLAGVGMAVGKGGGKIKIPTRQANQRNLAAFRPHPRYRNAKWANEAPARIPTGRGTESPGSSLLIAF